MKITLFDTNRFQIFDGDGNSVPEHLMKLAVSKNGTGDLITVTNGDSGRGFYLQGSTNLANANSWINCSPVTFVSPTNGMPSLFNVSRTNAYMFFRTATTNTPPTY